MVDLCNGKELLYDQACLILNNLGTAPLHISSQSSECYQCPLLPLVTLHPVKSKAIVVSTVYERIFEVLDANQSCRERFHFNQHGFYQWNMTSLKLCDKLSVIKDPNNVYLPLWVAIAILVALITSWLSAIRFSQRLRMFLGYAPFMNEVECDFGTPSSSPDSTSLAPTSRRVSHYSSNRVKALDAFRGITICLMIFVNAGGGKYNIFSHSAWNGLSLSDVIFPWFAWIMGIGILLSLRCHVRENVAAKQLFLNILRRSILLISFGIMLNSVNSNDLHRIRIPGVLQRLGISYFVVASLELLIMKPHVLGQTASTLSRCGDLISRLQQWFLLLIFAVFHVVLLLDSSVPGCPKGYLGPGGLHMNGSAFNCTGGFAGFLDRLVFGKHMYMRPTSVEVYHSVLPFDPEGLLGILTTIVTVGFGAQAGQILINYRSCKSRVVRLLVWSLITGIGAGFLCGWQKEGGFIPINKNLWSVSYVLATASLAFLALSILYLIVDYKGIWSGYPFTQAGKNPLILYILSVLFKNTLPWSWRPFNESTHMEFLFMHLWGTFLWVIVALALDSNKIYFVL